MDRLCPHHQGSDVTVRPNRPTYLPAKVPCSNLALTINDVTDASSASERYAGPVTPSSSVHLKPAVVHCRSLCPCAHTYVL